jgi:hypothetical protein
MNKPRQILSASILAFVCLIAASEARLPAVVYAQESPTDTPVEAYTLEVSRIDGDARVWGGIPFPTDSRTIAVLSGDSSSIIARYCGKPENAATCSEHTGDDLWAIILQRCQYHPEMCAVSDSASSALEMAAVGDTLSAGDEIFTGDESGVALRKAGGDSASSGKPFLLAQRSALNITEVGGTPDAPEIRLRLDAGVLAILPGAEVVPGATFEVALNDAATVEALVPTDGPSHLPAFMLGHNPDTGDVVFSVLDGTVRFTLGEDSVDIPAGKRSEVRDSHDRYPSFNPQVEDMTDQDRLAWVSAFHYGDSDPEPFPILAPYLDGEPEPFPIYSLASADFAAVHTVEDYHPDQSQGSTGG